MKNHCKKVFIILIFYLFTLSNLCNAETSSESGEMHLNKFELIKDIEWAKPNGNSLTMDIYIPETGKTGYPVLVIFHGGGWLLNNNSTMDSMSTYIVKHSEYIVCNVNYRLLIDESNTITMNQMVEDAMGAVLWVKENIAAYKGDKTKIFLTGDSAGGHLAEMVVLGAKKLESDGFRGNSLGFHPTYLPEGETAEKVAQNNELDIQGVILSYTTVDIYESCLHGAFETQRNYFWHIAKATPRGIFGDSVNVNNNPELYKAVSPIYNIPESMKRKLPPHFCLVGSKDFLITPTSVKDYVSLLHSKGHQAQYWIYESRSHAFLDSEKNKFLGSEFRKDAPQAIDRIIEFMNNVIRK